MVPVLDSRAWDIRARSSGSNDNSALNLSSSPCLSHMVGLTTCTEGLDAACCDAIGAWNHQGCWCDAGGKALLGALPRLVGTGMLLGLARACKQSSNVTQC
jgi:hypothetical protein